ncbi:hypothetical protein MBLNU230_g7957t1 [Neophaeotheca triangularis]
MSQPPGEVYTSRTTEDASPEEIEPVESYERISVRPKGTESAPSASSSASSTAPEHGAVEMTDVADGDDPPGDRAAAIDNAKGRFGYLKTKQFWLVLALSQLLAVSITGTNTLSGLLDAEGTSIPAFQSLFNYILLTLIYTSYTFYKYGAKGWAAMVYRQGWRYFILAFCDVMGNYFTVLAYRYTNIMSAQLINFWAIAVVVAISLIFLKVRYHVAQYIGIVICCGGLGILVASDQLTGDGNGPVPDEVKGDLFALLGATFYGLANVSEEYLVSKKPLYEVIGQLSFWAIPINGVTAAIFDRQSFRTATWNSRVGGYLTGYTLILTFFYSGAPLVFRMASAAFFNIGLLTGNFWGVIVGLHVFGLSVHFMYPIAFVCIILGLVVYHGTEGVLGEAKKPWLGVDQAGGSDGIGTARRRVENPNVIV